MTRTIRPNPLAAWLLATCAAATMAAPAHAFVLCARSGTGGDPNEGASVKIRSACKDTETALDPATLGLAAGGVATIVRTGNQVSTNGTLSTPANCEAGEVTTGGGALSIGNDGALPVLKATRPQPDTAGATPTGWRSTVTNIADTGTITVTAYVVCTRSIP